MKSNFVEYHIFIIDILHKTTIMRIIQLRAVNSPAYIEWDTLSLFLPPSIWNLTHHVHHESLSRRVYKVNNVSCQNGPEKVNFWHFFNLKVEMSSFGLILSEIIFFIDNVHTIKNNICFQKLSFEASKNHVYKCLIHDCYLTLW